MPTRVKDQIFDAELMEAMRLAFHEACETLQLGGEDDALAEIVAAKIIALAVTGENDPGRLCSQALSGLSERRQAS